MPILTTLGAACAKAWGFTSGLAKDQYFNLVSLLLPGNGTNGAQNNTFLDSSTNNFTITRNGNTTQGTFSPFSQTGWGNYFNGSSRLSVSSNVALTPGSGDFTIECWIYPTAAFSTFNGIFVGDTNGAMNFGKISGGIGLRISGVADIISATAPSINQWTHIAITRSGTDVRLFYNGIQQGSTVTNSTNFAQSTVYLGDNGAGTAYWNGYLSNLRFVKSTALYTSNFTPSTTPLTAISNTQFLTFQSNRFVDNSSNAFAITTSGSPSVVAFSPFAPTAAYTTAAVGGSGYFDGTADYLTAPSNIVDFAAGQAFTVECWVYVSSNTPGQAISANGANAFSLAISGGQVLYGKAGVADVLVGTMAAANQWVHVAVGRNSSNTSRLWVNGTSVATSGSDTYSFNAATMYIGSNSTPAAYLNGYMAGLRVVKGSDVYGVANTSITVPTAPFTAITNTQLLLNYTNAGITDATAKNDLETVGNAQISTTQSKWGGGSMSFDGSTSKALGRTSPNLNMGSGDFTVECWVYWAGGSVSYQNFVGSNSASFTGNATFFRVWGSSIGAPLASKIGIGNPTHDATSSVYSTNNLPTNTWTHVAATRSNGIIRVFIDGNLEKTGSSDTSVYDFGDNGICIGQSPWDGANGWFNGYVDDLRITKGFARYTANFPKPTAPFPVQ